MRISVSIQVIRGEPAPARHGRFLVPFLLLALVVPGMVLASDTFPDVPDSNIFHGDINRVYDARIAAGCGGGNYCPSQNVTREQMAAFLSRVGSRASVDYDLKSLPDNSGWTDIATVAIKPGNVTGGTAFVMVVGQAYGYTSTDGVCPCTMATRLVNPLGSDHGYSFVTITNTPSEYTSQAFRLGNTSNTWVYSAPTGVSGVYKLQASVTTTTGNLAISGNVSAIYAPFGGQGGAALTPDLALEPALGSQPMP